VDSVPGFFVRKYLVRLTTSNKFKNVGVLRNLINKEQDFCKKHHKVLNGGFNVTATDRDGVQSNLEKKFGGNGRKIQ
jgi:hypothetical protein